VARQVGADLRGASLNLDGGCDAARHRNGMFPAGLIPNITESPRQRKTTKRGRKRRFDAAIQALRMRVERTLAWEDTCQRWWLRCERLQPRHSGMTLSASTMLNLRAVCGASHSPPVHSLVTQ
jgi:transposase